MKSNRFPEYSYHKPVDLFDYVSAVITLLIHCVFEEILSYIRGRSTPTDEHAILHGATPTTAHRLLSGSKHMIELPAYSSSYWIKKNCQEMFLNFFNKSKIYSHYNPVDEIVLQYINYSQWQLKYFHMHPYHQF